MAIQSFLPTVWRTGPPGAFGLRQGRGLVLAMPLPLLGRLFVVERWPIVVAPFGVWARGELLSWEALAKVTAAGTSVRAGGDLVALLASGRAARDLAALLSSLADPAERDARIDAALAARFDRAAAAARMKKFRRASLALHGMTNLVWLSLFVGVPLVVFSRLGGYWEWFAAVGIWSWLVAATILPIAARRCGLDPAERPAAGKLIGAMVYPIGLIRSVDLLSRDLFAPFDPLPAAAVALPRARFLELARATLAELRHTVDDDEPADAAAWRSRIEKHACRMLDGMGVDPEALLAPPARDEAECKRYCPRCRNQYVVERARCATCRNIALVSFDVAPKAIAEKPIAATPAGNPPRRGRRKRGGASRR